MRSFYYKDFLKYQLHKDIEVLPIENYATILKGVHEDISKAEEGNLSDDKIHEMNIIKAEIGTFEPIKVEMDDDTEKFFVIRRSQVDFAEVEKGDLGEILKASGGTYSNTPLNRQLNRVGADFEIMKAQGHKYFKREPKAGGGYKYYYTEEQYKKEKQGGGEKDKQPKQEKKEGVWSKKEEAKVAENDKAFKEHLKKKNIEPYSYEASQEWKNAGFKDKQMEIFGKKKEDTGKEGGISKEMKQSIAEGKKVQIPVTDKAWIKVVEANSGYGDEKEYRVQHVFNEGNNAGQLFQEKTPEKAISRAEKILAREKELMKKQK